MIRATALEATALKSTEGRTWEEQPRLARGWAKLAQLLPDGGTLISEVAGREIVLGFRQLLRSAVCGRGQVKMQNPIYSKKGAFSLNYCDPCFAFDARIDRSFPKQLLH